MVSQPIISWSEALKQKSFVIQLLTFTLALLLVVSYLPYYFHSIIGPRQGVQLNDAVLNLLSPRDYSWVIFSMIYLSLIITVQGIVAKPLMILLGIKCYLAITLVRMIAMYVFTLEPPAGIIPLHDPIVDIVAYGGEVFNKDLFYSGHVATLTLFVMIEKRPGAKIFLVLVSIAVAILILAQRVHYTIDVMIAPIIVYGSYQLMFRFQESGLQSNTKK